MSEFHFKHFLVKHYNEVMKVGTDSILLGAWVQGHDPTKALDIGCGSGVLSLMMAQKFPHLEIEALDIDPKAVKASEENISRSAWLDRVSVQCASFQSFIDGKIAEYDLMISNPPFFEKGILSKQESKSKIRHTITLNHFELLNGAKTGLKDKGKLYLILPFESLDIVTRHLVDLQLFLNRICKVKPFPNSSYNRMLLEISGTGNETQSNELIIYKSAGVYTDDFRILTQDFYLQH